MKKRTIEIFIEDILESMDKIGHYINDLTYETFVKNEIVVDAVIREFEIIGEATKNLSIEFKGTKKTKGISALP